MHFRSNERTGSPSLPLGLKGVSKLPRRNKNKSQSPLLHFRCGCKFITFHSLLSNSQTIPPTTLCRRRHLTESAPLPRTGGCPVVVPSSQGRIDATRRDDSCKRGGKRKKLIPQSRHPILINTPSTEKPWRKSQLEGWLAGGVSVVGA